MCQQTLALQSTLLEDKARKIDAAKQLNRQAIVMLERNSDVDWLIIAKTIKVLNMKDIDIQTWSKEYLNPAEQQQFNQIGESFSAEEMAAYQQQWASMFKKVKEHINTDPTEKRGQQLFEEWMALVKHAYGEHADLQTTVWEAIKSGAIPKDMMPYFDQEVIDYIGKAAQHFYADGKGEASLR